MGADLDEDTCTSRVADIPAGKGQNQAGTVPTASERTWSHAGGHRKGTPLNPSLNKIKRKCDAEGSLATITGRGWRIWGT
jgi:hypothetical protein